MAYSVPQWDQNKWYNHGVQTDKGFQDWFLKTQGHAPKFSEEAVTTGYRGIQGLTALGGPAGMIGYANLAQILANNGKTDPAAFNRQLSGISSGNQQQQNSLQAILAQRGLGSSGVGQALGQAVGQAGQSQIAGARANEAQMTEQRKRDDLSLLLDLIVNPSLNAGSIGLGQGNFNTDQKNRSRDQRNQQYGELFKGLITAICWVAEEIFHNPQDEDAVRLHMTTDPVLMSAYLAHGKELAFLVKHNEAVRAVVEPRFHEFADHGYAMVG